MMNEMILSVVERVWRVAMWAVGVGGVVLLILGALAIGLWPVWVGIAALKYLLT